MSQAQEVVCIYGEVWKVNVVGLVCGKRLQPARTSSVKVIECPIYSGLYLHSLKCDPQTEVSPRRLLLVYILGFHLRLTESEFSF